MFKPTYKTLAVTSVALALLALAACGKKGDDTTTAPMTPAPMTTSPSESPSASPSGSSSAGMGSGTSAPMTPASGAK